MKFKSRYFGRGTPVSLSSPPRFGLQLQRSTGLCTEQVLRHDKFIVDFNKNFVKTYRQTL